MAKLTMLELQQMHEQDIFGEIATIPMLIELSSPPLNYNTVMNAINKGKVTARLFTTAGNGSGIWLVYLPSARNLWTDRFTKGTK